jgi:hypothetical protein
VHGPDWSLGTQGESWRESDEVLLRMKGDSMYIGGGLVALIVIIVVVVLLMRR